MAHPSKTLIGETVVYNLNGKPHAALVMHVHPDDPHKACLVYYCPVSHAWKEAIDVEFGKDYTNVESS